MRVRLTKKNLAAAEPRRSRKGIDEDAKDLRNAALAAQKLSLFYSNHIAERKQSGEKPMIMPRDATQILGQMRNQRVYVCEEEGKPDGGILAASLLWDDEIPVPSEVGPHGYEVVRFLEIGTQLSTLPGFNLQWTLTAVTLFEQLLFDPTGMVFAATYGDNKESEQNFLDSMKFVSWEDIPPTVLCLRLHHLEEGGPEEVARGVKWYRPTSETVIAAARRIVDHHDNPTRQVSARHGTATVKSIEFSFDHDEFRAAPFKYILDAARDVAARQPRTYDEFRQVASSSLGHEFIVFDR